MGNGYSQILHHSQVCPTVRLELKFKAHSLSPLKWTEFLTQSSLDDFRYEVRGLNPRRVIATGARCEYYLEWNQGQEPLLLLHGLAPKVG